MSGILNIIRNPLDLIRLLFQMRYNIVQLKIRTLRLRLSFPIRDESGRIFVTNVTFRKVTLLRSIEELINFTIN